MSVFVPVVDGVQAELVFVLDEEIVTNRLWFTFDTPPWEYADLLSLATGLHTWYAANILPSLSHDLILYQTRVSDWTADPSPLVADFFGAVQGGNLSGCHSANVAVVVPFKWPLGSRRRRNKHFVPGIPLDQLDLNTPAEALVDALFEGYAALIDYTRFNINPLFTWRWRVASAFSGGVPRSEQFVRSCQGPARDRIRLGQRRKRLPLL